ncbi:hypothetical protein, partial [Streptomyces sp. NPDC001389]|uniref:hypothetical protein n=1 Tax=Streptomyces sp. NPDC001389 TaxID=3364569 RepID=UPI0036960F87
RPLLIRKIPTPHTVIITARGVDRNPDLKHGLVDAVANMLPAAHRQRATKGVFAGDRSPRCS